MKKLLSTLSTLFLALVTNVAFADSTSTFMNAPALANKTDLSLAYLDQVFGTVGNVLTGTSGQMLGHLFYQFNNGVLIVAGMWLGYTVFTICVKSAQEGSFMGANKNVALVFLKIAFGMSLLFPYSATGYSLLQDITMKIVVEGIGLADELWDAGLNYISSGGVVWHPPENSGSTMTTVNGAPTITDTTVKSVLGKSDSVDSSSGKGMGQVIFANLVCMYASTDSTIPTSGSNTTTPLHYYDTTEDDANNRFTFGGGSTGSSTACGSVSWNVKSVCDDANTISPDTSDVDSEGSSEALCATSRNAVYNMIQNLEPAAYNYYCSQYGNALSNSGICVDSTAGQTDIWNDNVNYFFNAVVDYVNGILPVASSLQDNYNGTDNFLTEARTEGWLSAGRYYWDLAQTTAVYASVTSINSYVPSSSGLNLHDSSVSGTAATAATNAFSQANDYIETTKQSPTVISLIANFNDAQNPGTGDVSYSSSDDGLNKYVKLILKDFLDSMNSLIGVFTLPQTYIDPIAFLVKVGNLCLATAGIVWVSMGAAFASVMLMGIGCQASVNMSGPLAAAINWIQPLFMAVAGMLVLAGAVLGFYVPLYPYMLFLFGVIGWIIAVIEAMVAAPLVCFGLTHPEGHDFLGEAKQALMLWLGIFLRPALMVIGLIAGMILSYVSLRILVYTFSGITSDMFATAASGAASGNVLSGVNSLYVNSATINASSGLTGFVKTVLIFPITLAIFTSMVYAVVTQCFSLIYVLPDYIMRWIGGPVDQHRTGPAQLAGIAQSSVSQGAQGLDQGVKGQMSATSQNVDRARQWRQERDQNKKNNGIKGGQ